MVKEREVSFLVNKVGVKMMSLPLSKENAISQSS